MAQNAAEDLSTAPTLEDGASEDRMDQIADLLVEDSTEDSTEEATPTDELPTEDEDSDEESDETTEEDSDLEAIAEDDTWESVLGVKQGQVNFDEEGNQPLIDYYKMMKVIKEGGYKGYIGVEYEGDEMGEIEGIKATRQLILKAAADL